jgi:hypothetical protein
VEAGSGSRTRPRGVLVLIGPKCARAVKIKYRKLLICNGGALNSAVECHLHTVEVIGSNPIAPTIRPILFGRDSFETLFLLPLLLSPRSCQAAVWDHRGCG